MTQKELSDLLAMNDLDRRLRQVMASVFNVDAARLTDADSSKTIPEWDSVNHMHLILSLEAEFGIQFDAGEIAELVNVGLIRQRIAQGTVRG